MHNTHIVLVEYLLHCDCINKIHLHVKCGVGGGCSLYAHVGEREPENEDSILLHTLVSPGNWGWGWGREGWGREGGGEGEGGTRTVFHYILL